jgi:glycosyltransferase involved in cell wall biosynthesis
MAKVGIIMAVYNQEKFIKDAVKSVLDQSFTDFSLIIINDGSTDKSSQIITSFTDKRIEYVVNPNNKGLIYSLNLGIEICMKTDCKYIARMDSDDWAWPDRLMLQVNYLDQHAEVGVLGTAVQLFGSIQQKKYMPVTQRKILPTFYCYNPFFHPSMMLRKEIVKDKRYDFSFPKYEDYGLWVDLIGTCVFHNLPNILINYRKHEDSVTSTYKHDQIADQAMFINILKHLNSKLNMTLSDKELQILSIITSPSRTKIDEGISIKNLKEIVYTITGKADNAVIDKSYFKQLLVERAIFYLIWSKRKADLLRFVATSGFIKEIIGVLRSEMSNKKWVSQ